MSTPPTPHPSLHDLWSKRVKLGPSLLAIVAIVAIVNLVIFRILQQPSVLDTSAHLGIDDLVTKIRSELEKVEVQRQSGGEQALFEMKNFDLEISFVVKQTGKAEGKLEAEVITIGGAVERSKEAAQKVTLHMDVIPSQPVMIQPVKSIDVPPDAVQLPPQ